MQLSCIGFLRENGSDSILLTSITHVALMIRCGLASVALFYGYCWKLESEGQAAQFESREDSRKKELRRCNKN